MIKADNIKRPSFVLQKRTHLMLHYGSHQKNRVYVKSYPCIEMFILSILTLLASIEIYHMCAAETNVLFADEAALPLSELEPVGADGSWENI